MKTVTIPIEISVGDDIVAVTVDKSGLICCHITTEGLKPIVKNRDGLRDEWLLLGGRVLGRIDLKYGYIENWKETLRGVQ